MNNLRHFFHQHPPAAPRCRPRRCTDNSRLLLSPFFPLSPFFHPSSPSSPWLLFLLPCSCKLPTFAVTRKRFFPRHGATARFRASFKPTTGSPMNIEWLMGTIFFLRRHDFLPSPFIPGYYFFPPFFPFSPSFSRAANAARKEAEIVSWKGNGDSEQGSE